jgi:hypothetical protein
MVQRVCDSVCATKVALCGNWKGKMKKDDSGQPVVVQMHIKELFHRGNKRVKGIEPSYEAWEASVLPLNYTRTENPHQGCICNGMQ